MIVSLQHINNYTVILVQLLYLSWVLKATCSLEPSCRPPLCPFFRSRAEFLMQKRAPPLQLPALCRLNNPFHLFFIQLSSLSGAVIHTARLRAGVVVVVSCDLRYLRFKKTLSFAVSDWQIRGVSAISLEHLRHIAVAQHLFYHYLMSDFVLALQSKNALLIKFVHENTKAFMKTFKQNESSLTIWQHPNQWAPVPSCYFEVWFMKILKMSLVFLNKFIDLSLVMVMASSCMQVNTGGWSELPACDLQHLDVVIFLLNFLIRVQIDCIASLLSGTNRSKEWS